MILQALTSYYEALVATGEGEISELGWCRAKVVAGLQISQEGELCGVMPLRVEKVRGKKKVERPQVLDVPMQEKKAAGIAANFLCDSPAYLLGIGEKQDRAAKCFKASKELHHKVLDDVDSPAAKAILNYYDKWDCKSALKNSVVAGNVDTLSGGGVVFMVDGAYAHNDETIREEWTRRWKEEADGPVMQCLVTGRMESIARLHPSIKGVKDAQPSGASIVSFNDRAYESFGRKEEQGLNAPVGKYAAFMYTTALNHLLADEDETENHRVMIGDMTIVYWAASAEPQYEEVFRRAMDPNPYGRLMDDDEPEDDGEMLLDAFFKKLEKGEQVDGFDMNMPFFVLGLAPNASRLAVRFFLRSTFGKLMENLKKHHERLEIVKPPFERRYISLYALLHETVNPKATDKAASPLMAGAVMRSILGGLPYPSALYTATVLRIKATQDDTDKHIQKINSTRAAIIKAYFMKREDLKEKYEEVLKVNLQDKSKIVPYVLGRMFYVLEEIQIKANSNLKGISAD